ncbi:hypothetical protein [Actinoplanes sp. NPDC023714]|uniref:hypothetical protein n=1 Tax=Actinoplanes sp. NPDC023714 TaxID=3154322 RepID=UPI0033C8E0D7
MTTTPRTVELHCRLTVRVDDPAAVTALAVRRLRAANIDWDEEEDDLETAAAELGADLLTGLASLADPDGLLAGVPGVAVTGAHVRATNPAGAPSPADRRPD